MWPNTNFERVLEFHEKFDCLINSVPTLIDKETSWLRLGLIEEELQELRDAISEKNIVGIADALGDLLYVVYGTGISYGLEMDAIVKEIHRSNMTKLGADGKPVRREDGKILKGPSYEPPNLEAVVKESRI